MLTYLEALEYFMWVIYIFVIVRIAYHIIYENVWKVIFHFPNCSLDVIDGYFSFVKKC